jgi:hypothetical protein
MALDGFPPRGPAPISVDERECTQLVEKWHSSPMRACRGEPRASAIPPGNGGSLAGILLLITISRNFAASNCTRRSVRRTRYRPSPTGLRAMTALVVLRDKIIKPLLAGCCHRERGRKPRSVTALDAHYERLQTEMQGLFDHPGLAASRQRSETDGTLPNVGAGGASVLRLCGQPRSCGGHQFRSTNRCASTGK